MVEEFSVSKTACIIATGILRKNRIYGCPVKTVIGIKINHYYCDQCTGTIKEKSAVIVKQHDNNFVRMSSNYFDIVIYYANYKLLQKLTEYLI